MKNVGHRKSLSKECGIGSHILAGVDGEGVGRWTAKRGKKAPSGS